MCSLIFHLEVWTFAVLKSNKGARFKSREFFMDSCALSQGCHNEDRIARHEQGGSFQLGLGTMMRRQRACLGQLHHLTCEAFRQIVTISIGI